MKTSAVGRSIIKHFEGFRADLYICPGGHLTIGYGHKIIKGEMIIGRRVYPPDVSDIGVNTMSLDMAPGSFQITEAVAGYLLKEDLFMAELEIDRLVKVDLEQFQFDALADFTYNEGIGNLRESTLLRMINERRFLKAAGEFGRWIRCGNKVEPGLILRRAADALCFIGSDWRKIT